MIATTTEEVEKVLIQAQASVQEDNFSISMREKNKEFLQQFGLKRKDIKGIVQALTNKDFCEKRKSISKFRKEEVFIFAPTVDLVDNFGTKYKHLQVYLKFSFVEKSKLFVISLHLPTEKLKYYFRKEE